MRPEFQELIAQAALMMLLMAPVALLLSFLGNDYSLPAYAAVSLGTVIVSVIAMSIINHNSNHNEDPE